MKNIFVLNNDVIQKISYKTFKGVSENLRAVKSFQNKNPVIVQGTVLNNGQRPLKLIYKGIKINFDVGHI